MFENVSNMSYFVGIASEASLNEKYQKLFPQKSCEPETICHKEIGQNREIEKPYQEAPSNHFCSS